MHTKPRVVDVFFGKEPVIGAGLIGMPFWKGFGVDFFGFV